jgi:hypothetical protein
MKTGIHWLAALVGIGLLGIGVWAAAQGWPTTGTSLIFVFGLACLALPLLVDRVTKLTYKDFVAELTPETSEELREIGLSGAAATYAFVHNELAGDPKTQELKIRLQDKLVAMVKENAFQEPVDAARAREAIEQGSPAERVLAFGWLQADPTAATLDLLVQGIEHSRSANEQFHALRAAAVAQARLSQDEVGELHAAIDRAPWLRDDSDRRKEAELVLRRPLTPTPEQAPAP